MIGGFQGTGTANTQVVVFVVEGVPGLAMLNFPGPVFGASISLQLQVLQQNIIKL